MKTFEKAGIFFISSLILAGFFLHNPTRGYSTRNKVGAYQYLEKHSNLSCFKESEYSISSMDDKNAWFYRAKAKIKADEERAIVEKEIDEKKPNKTALGLPYIDDFTEFMNIRNLSLMQWKSNGAIVKSIAFMGNFVLYEALCFILLVMWCFLFIGKNKPVDNNLTGGSNMYCNKCGTDLDSDSNFCVKCGAPVPGFVKANS